VGAWLDNRYHGSIATSVADFNATPANPPAPAPEA